MSAIKRGLAVFVVSSRCVGAQLNLTVYLDATYAIDQARGPICGGVGDLPTGTACPYKGDIATADCNSIFRHTTARIVWLQWMGSASSMQNRSGAASFLTIATVQRKLRTCRAHLRFERVVDGVSMGRPSVESTTAIRLALQCW
ncbi:hypothetical protein GQ600_1802 [Phytophthora cactorum]|nr:hypothetical protein GQ600_1802 [Phytophthora cactorum]